MLLYARTISANGWKLYAAPKKLAETLCERIQVEIHKRQEVGYPRVKTIHTDNCDIDHCFGIEHDCGFEIVSPEK